MNLLIPQVVQLLARSRLLACKRYTVPHWNVSFQPSSPPFWTIDLSLRELIGACGTSCVRRYRAWLLEGPRQSDLDQPTNGFGAAERRIGCCYPLVDLFELCSVKDGLQNTILLSTQYGSRRRICEVLIERLHVCGISHFESPIGNAGICFDHRRVNVRLYSDFLVPSDTIATERGPSDPTTAQV